jgi:hypothetical protein
MEQPDQLDVDPIHNEIYVSQQNPDRVLVFRREANGNVAPIRTLKAPPGVQFGGSVTVDPINNLLLIAGAVATEKDRLEGGTRRRDQARILIYDRTAQGSAAPKGMIGGPTSHFSGASGGSMAVYPAKGWILAVSSWDPGQSSGSLPAMWQSDGYVGVWSITDRGDVPPRWIVGGPNGVFQRPHNIVLDPKNKSLIVSDQRLNAVLTFFFPEMF